MSTFTQRADAQYKRLEFTVDLINDRESQVMTLACVQLT